MSTVLISLAIGGGLGALLGRFGQCRSGACPLTANWKRGAVYGAVLGLLFYFASGGAAGVYQPPKNVKAVSQAEFDAEVLRAGQPVVVDFFATWCGPCKTLAPRLDELAGELSGKVKFVSVNVDQASALASKYNVQGIPMLLFFDKEGTMVSRSVGLVSTDTLRSNVAALISKQRD